MSDMEYSLTITELVQKKLLITKSITEFDNKKLLITQQLLNWLF